LLAAIPAATAVRAAPQATHGPIPTAVAATPALTDDAADEKKRRKASSLADDATAEARAPVDV
jgi:hypothetical protein